MLDAALDPPPTCQLQTRRASGGLTASEPRRSARVAWGHCSKETVPPRPLVRRRAWLTWKRARILLSSMDEDSLPSLSICPPFLSSPPSLHLPLPPIERARLRCLRSEEALSTHAPSRLFGLAAFAADADATGWKSDPAPPIGAALCWLEPCRARAVPAVSWVRASHAQHRAGPGGNSGARRDCARPDTGTRDPPAHCPSVLAQRAVTLE